MDASSSPAKAGHYMRGAKSAPRARAVPSTSSGKARGDRFACEYARCQNRWGLGLRLNVIRVHKLLEFGMKEIRAELVLLHLLERLIRTPAVVRHAIDGRHDSSSMTTT